VARVDPTEQELGNCDVARVDPTEQEPGNCDVARVDPTEQELGNCDVTRVDPTEQELENCDIVRADLTERELGNCDAARVDPTEQELGNYDFRLLARVSPGANPEIWRECELGCKFVGLAEERFGRNGELWRKSGDLAERVNSGANPEIWSRRDLAERVNSGTNPETWPRRDLTCLFGPLPASISDLPSHSWSLQSVASFEQVAMTSSNSSTSVKVVSPPGSEETSQSDPEVDSSGASSGTPSPVDARVLRDLEVMMSDHDLDTTVTRGSLAVIRERYSIPAEYGLHVPEPGQSPYSLDVPGMCISVDVLEAGLRFPLHPFIEECLRWWRISPSQVAPNSWRYLVVFLGECRGAGIIPTRDLFMVCFRLCKSRGGYYLTARSILGSAGHLLVTKVGSPAIFTLVVRFGGSGSIGQLTRSAMPPIPVRGGNCLGRPIEEDSFLFSCDQGDGLALARRGGFEPGL
ncbi:hypothetical protein B296_00051672, partial [Ensete ventricosum]